MPIQRADETEVLSEVRATIEALASLKTPLSESASESERHARALAKQSEAHKLARSGLASVEKSLLSIASGSKSAGQALAGLAQSLLRDLLKTTLRASITRPLQSLFSVSHAGGIVGQSRRTRAYPQTARFALAADEIPLIAQRGEEILSRVDPRHRANLSPSVVVNVSVRTPQGRDAEQNMHQQTLAIANAVREGALAAIEQQAERGGRFARAVGRRRR